MSKYSKDLSPELVEKIKNVYNQYGLNAYGVNLDIVRLKKSKGQVGEVLVGNDAVKLFSNKENPVAIAVPEELWEQVDDETQTIWTESLLEQILIEEDKDGNLKIKLKKPELNIPLGVYGKYGKKAVEKFELAYLTLEQMREQEELEKEMKKEAKKTGSKVTIA